MANVLTRAFLFMSFLTAFAVGLEFNGLPKGYKAASIQHKSCRWMCGDSGQFLQCQQTEIAVGTCGSGDWAQCSDVPTCGTPERAFTAIYCCTVTVLARKTDETLLQLKDVDFPSD